MPKKHPFLEGMDPKTGRKIWLAKRAKEESAKRLELEIKQMDPNFHSFTKSLIPAGSDLRELARQGRYKYEIFKLMKYEPHEAQRHFHNAVPYIETIVQREGNDPECLHISFTVKVNPRDAALNKKICDSCGAMLKDLYHNRYRFILAGARFGKSLAMGKEAVVQGKLLWPGITATGEIDTSKSPKVIIYAPKYETGEFEFNEIIWGMEELGLRPKKYSSSPITGNLYAEWEWGSSVKVKSWDNPKSLLGDEIDCAVLAESAGLPLSIWNRYIRPRLGSRMGAAISGTTGQGLGGFIDTMRDRGLDPKKKEYRIWQFATADNPFHSREDIEEARNDLDDETFAEQYEGKLRSMTGLMYPKYDFEIHEKVQVHKVPPGLDVVSCVDFGWANPLAFMTCYWDGDGGLHQLSEWYQTKQTIQQHWDDHIFENLKRYLPEYILYDWADPHSAFQLEELIMAAQEDGHLPVDRCFMLPAMKDKTSKKGVSAFARVRQLLHFNKGADRAYFEHDPSCEYTRWEIERYARKKNVKEKVQEDGSGKDDHLMDCLRYIVNTTYEEASERRDRMNQAHEAANAPVEIKHVVNKEYRQAWNDAVDDHDSAYLGFEGEMMTEGDMIGDEAESYVDFSDFD